MRHPTWPALLVTASILLASCGGGDEPSADPATMPTSGPSTESVTATPSETTTVTPSQTGSGETGSSAPGRVEPDSSVVALLSDTAVGGTVDRRPVLVGTRRDVRRFVAQFDSRAFARDVRSAILEAQLPEGHVLVAAVAAIGCHVPAGVELVTRKGVLRVRTERPDAPEIECLAPMTTVGVFTVAETAAGGLRHNGAA